MSFLFASFDLRLNVFFFQMKGVTEIHISCAFQEHNICNTKVLIIDNWNQYWGFYDCFIFEKLQTVQKLEI